MNRYKSSLGIKEINRECKIIKKIQIPENYLYLYKTENNVNNGNNDNKYIIIIIIEFIYE